MEKHNTNVKNDPTQLESTELKRKIKIGGFFGREIEVNDNGKNHVSNDQTPNTIEEEELITSIAQLKPPKKRKSKIKLCMICGATVLSTTCRTCGAKVD